MDETLAEEGLTPRRSVPATALWVQATALVMIGVELFWVVPWYETLLRITTVAPPRQVALVLGGIMLFGYVLAYSLEIIRLRFGFQIGLQIGLFLLALLIGETILLNSPLSGLMKSFTSLNPGTVLVLFFVIWMYWRGSTLGRDSISPVVAFRRFELGMLMLMAYTFVGMRMFGSSVEAMPVLTLFVFYLFTGLFGIVLARISYIGHTQGVRKNPFDWRWLATTLVILVLSVGLAAILGILLTGQYALLFDWFGEAFRILAAVVIFIVSLPGLLLSNLFGPLIPFFRRALANAPIISLGQEQNIPLEKIRNVPPLPAAAQALIFWGTILIILGLLIFRVRKRMGKVRFRETQDQESLLKEGEGRRLILKAWEDALIGLEARLRPSRRIVAAAHIRRIYAELMELCESLGRPRKLAQTPLEFLPDLGEIFPELSSELHLITEAYLKIRYGELPETQAEVDLVDRSWRRIEAEGQRLRKAGVGKLKTVEVKEVEKTGI